MRKGYEVATLYKSVKGASFTTAQFSTKAAARKAWLKVAGRAGIIEAVLYSPGGQQLLCWRESGNYGLADGDDRERVQLPSGAKEPAKRKVVRKTDASKRKAERARDLRRYIRKSGRGGKVRQGKGDKVGRESGCVLERNVPWWMGAD